MLRGHLLHSCHNYVRVCNTKTQQHNFFCLFIVGVKNSHNGEEKPDFAIPSVFSASQKSEGPVSSLS